ncbi:MAG: tRNA pseudouridine(38-40) synthase TruA [Caulobacteraceae bacterium]
MPRYRLTLEYDGGPYRGFQAQGDLPSVQGTLEAAILAFSSEAARVHVAGRTDTGVHATGQVVHFEVEREWRTDVIRDALNAYLRARSIVVIEAVAAPADFHARFSAIGRRYLYRILDRRTPPALEAARVWWVKTPLDGDAMASAAKALIGTHDFTTFRHVDCQANGPVKSLNEAEVVREGRELRLMFSARSFVHRQVRSMVGSLAAVGSGRWTEAQFIAALEARDRQRCAPVAPAHGLYLTGVRYEAEGWLGPER